MRRQGQKFGKKTPRTTASVNHAVLMQYNAIAGAGLALFNGKEQQPRCKSVCRERMRDLAETTEKMLYLGLGVVEVYRER